MKIIYCGFGKTGSRAIGDFIQEVTEYDTYIGKHCDLHSHPTGANFGPGVFTLSGDDMIGCMHTGVVQNKELYDFLKHHDDMIASDFPYFGMYKHINENYDDAKFIICIRETDSFVNSYMKHTNKQPPIGRDKANKCTLGVSGPCTEEHIEKLRLVYETYNYRVLNYFKDKPDKLLILKFEEIGTEKFENEILSFLGLDNPKNIKMKNIK